MIMLLSFSFVLFGCARFKTPGSTQLRVLGVLIAYSALSCALTCGGNKAGETLRFQLANWSEGNGNFLTTKA